VKKRNVEKEIIKTGEIIHGGARKPAQIKPYTMAKIKFKLTRNKN
jgi:hypothetical protein